MRDGSKTNNSEASEGHNRHYCHLAPCNQQPDVIPPASLKLRRVVGGGGGGVPGTRTSERVDAAACDCASTIAGPGDGRPKGPVAAGDVGSSPCERVRAGAVPGECDVSCRVLQDELNDLRIEARRGGGGGHQASAEPGSQRRQKKEPPPE